MQRRPPSPRLSIILAAIIALAAGCRRASEEQGTPVTAPPTDKSLSIVGHQKCAECHQEIAALHGASGHSRTFSLAKDSAAAKLLCDKKLSGGEGFGTYEYVCDQEGVAAAMPERFGGKLFPIDLAMGSGTNAVTFVTLTRGKAGETIGIEHRLTWYAKDGQFDITPAQQDLLPVVDGAYFGNVLEDRDLRRCIDCHTTSAKIVGTQLEDLYGGVHCERCHGPASGHVAAAERGDTQLARRLMHRDWTAKEEIQACGKCHRTVDDITPERLARYPKSVVRFQPVGIVKSRCYTESQGELRCTTCHDPHGPPSTRTMAQQVATCVSCHEKADHTKCPVSPAADCIRCHMPAIDLVRGIKFHDHWIRIRKDDGQPSDNDKSDSAPHSISR
jgi:predicted CXXCH cytochrome family protein